MNNAMMVDVDPLSSYDAQYDYTLPNAHYYQHQPDATPYTYKNGQVKCELAKFQIINITISIFFLK